MGIIDGHMHGRGAPGRWFADCADARGYEAYAFLSLSCMAAYGGERNNKEGLEAKRADPEGLRRSVTRLRELESANLRAARRLLGKEVS